MRFKYYRQLNTMDCGPTCLKMVAHYYEIPVSVEVLRGAMGLNKGGVTVYGIIEAAEKIGLDCEAFFASKEALADIDTPCILHWQQKHFVVFLGVKNQKYSIADPEKGVLLLKESEFLSKWQTLDEETQQPGGVVLVFQPSDNPPTIPLSARQKEKKRTFLLRFLWLKRKEIFKIFLALFIISAIQFTLPFLTQSVVDIGINGKKVDFISLVLMAQLMLILSRTFIEFIRSRIMLRISMTLNVQLLSNFWRKLTRLPISYFDARHTGDTFQRIEDQKQIQNFISGNSVSTFFSLFQFLIYSLILSRYKVSLLFIFLAGSALYLVWIFLFLKIKRHINNELFELASDENNATIEFIQGMQEIRLNNAENKKHQRWENIQTNLFRLNIKTLNYSQIQEAGAILINESMGIIVSYLVATLVIKGEITLGAMLAIQFIIGQLNGPIRQWVSFVQEGQNAKISLERLDEVQDLNDEDNEKSTLTSIPATHDIAIKDLSFKYPGSDVNTLHNINLIIPENKVTAIVGGSGSGKTTLIKLLLKIYENYEGKITVGTDADFVNLNHRFWRSICGAVLQDGYIFDDTIENNIVAGEGTIDPQKLAECCEIACIDDYIATLPSKYQTKIGAGGIGLSQGQRQRILIARAIYKNPRFLFFDEATNALDANKEKAIVTNLDRFFFGRTVIVVAHRLSTVRNADNIVVIENGQLIEQGKHAELIQTQGKYYELIKNQLELGV